MANLPFTDTTTLYLYFQALTQSRIMTFLPFESMALAATATLLK